MCRCGLWHGAIFVQADVPGTLDVSGAQLVKQCISMFFSWVGASDKGLEVPASRGIGYLVLGV